MFVLQNLELSIVILIEINLKLLNCLCLMIKQSNILFQPDKSSSFYVVSTNHSLTHAYMYIIYTSISLFYLHGWFTRTGKGPQRYCSSIFRLLFFFKIINELIISCYIRERKFWHSSFSNKTVFSLLNLKIGNSPDEEVNKKLIN